MDHPESDKLLGAVVFRSPTISRTLTPEAIPGSYNKELRSFHGSDKERGKVILWNITRAFFITWAYSLGKIFFQSFIPNAKGFLLIKSPSSLLVSLKASSGVEEWNIVRNSQWNIVMKYISLRKYFGNIGAREVGKRIQVVVIYTTETLVKVRFQRHSSLKDWDLIRSL